MPQLVVMWKVVGALAHVELSVAVTSNVNVPVAVGVPEITPPELNVNPPGKLPLLRLNVYEPLPPLAAIVCVYAVPRPR